jgi:membrane-associated phospholipid phosphatase
VELRRPDSLENVTTGNTPIPASPSRLRTFLRRRFSREETLGLYLTIGFLASALLVALFGILADEVFEVHGENPIDRTITLAVRALHAPGRDALALTITDLGDVRFLMPAALATVAVLCVKGRRVSALLFAGSVLGGWLLETVLKISFHRTRPDLWPALVTEKTASFPSGHATMTTVFFGGIVALVFHLTKNRRARAGALFAGAVIVLAVGFTRIYLGAHWLTDVLAGYLVGLLWVVLCATGTEFFARRSAKSR